MKTKTAQELKRGEQCDIGTIESVRIMPMEGVVYLTIAEKEEVIILPLDRKIQCYDS